MSPTISDTEERRVEKPVYSTGELAELCEVSVRTVQFYDEKGLLPPAALSDGGRRLYGEADLRKLRLICLMKTLGLSLNAIKGVFESPDSTEVLLCLLEEQMRRVETELEEKEQVRRSIIAMMDGIRQTGSVSVESIGDVERIMQGKGKLKRDMRIMLAIGVVCDLVEVGTIVWWVTKGDWLPFAIGMPVVILVCALLVRMYYRDTAYICPHCHSVFKPSMRDFFWSSHTPRTRKLTCAVCGQKDWCIETTAEALGGTGMDAGSDAGR